MSIKAYTPLGGFGDATAVDVIAGKTFSSDSQGIKILGTRALPGYITTASGLYVPATLVGTDRLRPTNGFGTAKPTQVVSGVPFTSDDGIKQVGTMAISSNVTYVEGEVRASGNTKVRSSEVVRYDNATAPSERICEVLQLQKISHTGTFRLEFWYDIERIQTQTGACSISLKIYKYDASGNNKIILGTICDLSGNGAGTFHESGWYTIDLTIEITTRIVPIYLEFFISSLRGSKVVAQIDNLFLKYDLVNPIEYYEAAKTTTSTAAPVRLTNF